MKPHNKPPDSDYLKSAPLIFILCGKDIKSSLDKQKHEETILR